MLRNTKFTNLLASATVALPVILIIILAGASAAPSYAQDRLDIVASTPQAPLPAIPYLDENGTKKAFVTSARKLTAVHFWATWCVPCVDELPEIDKVLKEYEARGMQLIALSVDGKDNLPKVKEFFSQHGITSLKITLDPDMQVFSQAHIRGLPTTIFIDNNGNEIARAEGAIDWHSSANQEAIELLLQ